MKRIIKDYFTFSRKERIAVALLLVLLAIFVAFPYFYKGAPPSSAVNKALQEYLARTQNKLSTDSTTRRDAAIDAVDVISRKENPIEQFPFDPNIATREEWQRLGLREKTINTILHYVEKGGRFRKPEDIRKIWGIRKEDADRLQPLVRFAAKPGESASMKVHAATPVVQEKKMDPIDVNTATVEIFRTLPGIGEVLAGRIVKFREHAGGFTSVAQVGQTYGLPDSVFRKILPLLRLNPESAPKWNINAMTAYELSRRLQIDPALGRALVAYRRKNGLFQKVDELRQTGLLPDTLFQRIAGFLQTGN